MSQRGSPFAGAGSPTFRGGYPDRRETGSPAMSSGGHGGGHARGMSSSTSTAGMALNKLTGALQSTRAYLTPFANATSQSSSSVREGHQSEANRLLADIAPHIMRPRMLQAAAAASASVSNANSSSSMLGIGSGRLSITIPGRSLVRFSNIVRNGAVTSTDLRIQEASDQILLTAAMGEVEEPTGVAAEVSLYRGYQATKPSALDGKARRRKARGRDTPNMGLKAMSNSARGLMIENSTASAFSDLESSPVSKDARKAKRAAAAKSKEIPLSLEELQQQLDEIMSDKENISVRRMLLNSELNEVEAKIAALEQVKDGLNRRLTGLQEEELELDDEYEGVSQSVALQRHRRSMPGSNTQEAAAQASWTEPSARRVSTTRRTKGPLFLPSEHEELPSGVAFMTLTGHTGAITALDFSEPYGTLVTAAADETVRVWDLTAGAEVGRLRGHSSQVRCLQVEDELCITGAADHTIRLWDLRKVEDYETRISLAEQGDVSFQNLSGLALGDKSFADGDDPGADDPYNPSLRTLEGHSNSVTALYFDDNCLVTGASDKTLRQWDLNTGQCILTMDILWAISNPTASQSLSSASGSAGASSLMDSGFLPTRSPRVSGAFGSPPSLLSAGTFGGGPGAGGAGLNSWTGSFSHPTPAYADGSWEMYQDFVGGVQFWGYALASGSGDGAVRMWDMRTGQAHRTLLGHLAPVTCLQFDETYVVSGSLDKTIKIWDLRTGAISDTIKYEYPVTALQFDSRKIIAATGDNGVEVFNRTSLQHTSLILNGHTAPVEKLRYMDRYAVSGSKDGIVKTWAL